MALLAKPATCVGCPLYGDGMGFVPDVIVPNSTVTILAQNPGKDEESGQKITGWDGKRALYAAVPPQPLIGRTGAALDGYLKMSGLTREQVSRCNVLKCRMEVPGPKGKPKKVNDLPKGKMLQAAMAHCRQYLHIPASNHVIASGALAWKAMGGPGKISQWRGYSIPRGDTE